MSSLKERIKAGAARLHDEAVRVRRHLHMYPELSYNEHETSAFVRDYLDRLGIEHISPVAGTGVVGIIRGCTPGKGPTIGIRADMDALPVTETSSHIYVSKNKGVMHACGHDAHTAILLATATLLKELRSEYAGTILLVFQPGEEKAPGGARLMIESGVFEKFRPDIFLALHVLPELNTGTVGFHAGPYMASCDEIYITVAGKGGHAAQPSQYTDQVYIASELVVALKDTFEKEATDNQPTILGIGYISGQGATNVIPEKVEIAGTFRAFNEKWRKKAKDLIRETASVIALKRGVKIDVSIVEGYPVLVNNESLTSRSEQITAELLGSENVVEVPVRMGSEDFSFFSERYPSCLFRLGITPQGGQMKNLHTPLFDIDEQSLTNGIATMTWLAMNLTGSCDRDK